MNFVLDNEVIIAIFLFALVMWVTVALLSRLSSRPAARKASDDLQHQSEDFPYQREDYLLSPAERTFYTSLYTVAGADFQIFPKVRLIDLVRVRSGTADTQAYKNRIDRKHVDFVVWERDTFKPLLVIELDDASHRRARSQESDLVKDRVMEAAGLPMLRVAARGSYEPQELAARVRASNAPGRSNLSTAFKYLPSVLNL